MSASVDLAIEQAKSRLKQYQPVTIDLTHLGHGTLTITRQGLLYLFKQVGLNATKQWQTSKAHKLEDVLWLWYSMEEVYRETP